MLIILNVTAKGSVSLKEVPHQLNGVTKETGKNAKVLG